MYPRNSTTGIRHHIGGSKIGLGPLCFFSPFFMLFFFGKHMLQKSIMLIIYAFFFLICPHLCSVLVAGLCSKCLSFMSTLSSLMCVVMSRITDSTRRHIIPSCTGITLIVEQCMLKMEQCMLNMEQCMLVAQANMLLFSEICSRNAFF